MKEVIRKLVETYSMTPKEINGCYCYSFAEDLCNILFEKGTECELVNNEHFFKIDKLTDKVSAWNEEKFRAFMLDVPIIQASDVDFYHVFIFYKGLFFDAEASEGVKHWLDLPFYKRMLNKQSMEQE